MDIEQVMDAELSLKVVMPKTLEYDESALVATVQTLDNPSHYHKLPMLVHILSI